MDEMQVRDGMTLQPGERVEVYYNLHKGGFSIKSIDKRNPNRGKVVAYAPNVYIEGATFHISESKLAKIRENNRKTVYAVVRGEFKHCEQIDNATHELGYCNPFRTGMFVNYNTGEQLHEASAVYFYDKFFSYERSYKHENK